MPIKSSHPTEYPEKRQLRRFAEVVTGITVALGGLLLFSVQPIIAKYLLPWFGGSASTWTVCLVFFQGALLVGYVYAYLISARLNLGVQVILQLLLLAAAGLALPITPHDAWKPIDPTFPIPRMLMILSASVGIPYIVLATTSPLLQRWLSTTHEKPSVTWYFAISNLGSFIGLLGFPFIFEPLASSAEQTAMWSIAFVAYGTCFALCSLAILAIARTAKKPGTFEKTSRQILGDVVIWIGWAALGTALLLATSNFITESTIVVPFLWIMPLALYLLSFVLVFASARIYRRDILLPMFMVLSALTLHQGKPLTSWELVTQIALLSACLFSGCLICHGEISARQPDAPRLPEFYLAIAAGGALGGAFVSLIAPAIFNDTWEYFMATILISGSAIYLESGRHGRLPGKFGKPFFYGGVVAFCATVASYLAAQLSNPAIWQERNFYGVVKVQQDGSTDPQDRLLILYQSGEDQGEEYLAKDRRGVPSCDFGERSAIGLALRNVAARRDGGPLAPLRVGVVGLGAGMIMALAKPGDLFRFYEINPAVMHAATQYFSFVKTTQAKKVEVILGDGRLELERDALRGEPRFDLIVIDAYRGASPPMHLMTQEAYEVYLSMLTPKGVLAVDLDLDNFDLSPVHRGLSASLSLPVGWFDTPSMVDDCDDGVSWALYSRDADFWSAPEVKSSLAPWPDNSKRQIIWTDQRSNLFSVMIF